ncbi:unnamed protein product, partial [Ectocarpus sp. 8 AP-2014]
MHLYGTYKYIISSRSDIVTNCQLQQMGTFCESWDSNWMDGSCDGFQNNADDSDGGADAFEAALQPLPAWDGLAYSTNRGNAENDIVWGTRQRERDKSAAPSPSPEHHPGMLDDLDLGAVNLGPDKAGDCIGNVSSTLRTTKLAGDPDGMHPPIGQAWSVTRLTSPEPKPKGHDLETGDTLTHVIRLHRSGSVVVERKGKPNAPGGIIDDAGVLGPRQHAREKDYYAEEERFWQERCPPEADNAVVVQQTAPTASPRVTKANRRAANYDYIAAEAAYRAGSPAGKSVPPDGNGPLRGTGPGRPIGGRKSTRFEEEVDDCVQEKCATQGVHVPPPSPRRTARIGCSARAKAIIQRKRDKAQHRRFSSLRDAESVLRGVLESVEDAPSTEEDSSSAMRTPQEERFSVLRQKVADLVRDETHGERGECNTGKHGDSIGGTSPSKHRAQTSRQYDGDNGPSPLGIRWAGNRSGFGERGAMARDESQQVDQHEQRQCFEHKRAGGLAHSEEEEEAGDDEQESAGRVAELSRRIAMRCLRIEQECLRRERSQTRLFQEQLRGVRLGAQHVARRTIHDKRIRQKQLLLETQQRFEEKEKGLVAKLELAEESWKAERESLSADTAAAKCEVEKCRRQARAAAEAARNTTKEVLEKQRLDFQRGWAEEKGGLRRAAEDALRRAMEGNVREREEAATKAQTAQDSLDAQLRSWKAKAETAERRAAEEREKRRGLEA